MFLVHTSNTDLNLQPNEGVSQDGPKKHTLNHIHKSSSTHFSKNQGLSGVGQHQESDPEVEFAYNSDEDSVFSAYNTDTEKRSMPKKLYGKVSTRLEKDVKKRAKCILDEIEATQDGVKMLFKFNIDLEDAKYEDEKRSEDASRISVEEEKDKKAQLKNDFIEFKKSRYFSTEPDKRTLMRDLFEVAISANSIMKICGENQTFNTIEMSLNKKNVLLDKSKMLIVKMNNLLLLVPIKIARIEVKLRNTFFINEQPTLSALSTFVEFYLQTYAAKTQ